MKIPMTALLLLFAADSHAGRRPEYCVDFSQDACDRITAVVESKTKPDYCVPGFARADSGLHLSDEQIRICYVLTQDPPSADDDQVDKNIQARQSKLVEEARAMVKGDWEKYRGLIASIETGYKCDVVDQLSASVAITRIQFSMQEEVARAGISGDRTLSIKDFTDEAVRAGKAAAERGACTQLTPADRGRLRALVADLMQ